MIRKRRPAINGRTSYIVSHSPAPTQGASPSPPLFHPDDDTPALAALSALDEALAFVAAARAQLLAWQRPRVAWSAVRCEIDRATDKLQWLQTWVDDDDEDLPETAVIPAEPIADADVIVLPYEHDGRKGGGA